LLLLCPSIYGANTTFEVKASGGRWTTLQDAFGLDTTISSGDTLFIEISLAGTDSMTSGVDFTGWLINGTVYFKVVGDYKYDGDLDTVNGYFWKVANGTDLELDRAGTYVFEGFQINNSGGTTPPIKDDYNGLTVYFIDCLWYHCYRAYNPANASSTSYFVNNYFDSVSFSSSVGSTIEMDDGTHYFYHCIWYNPAEAIDQDGGTLTVTNCLFLDTEDPDGHLDLTGGTQTVTYCITDDGTADDYGGDGNVANCPPITFVDSSGGVSMLIDLSDTVCIDAGTTISDWIYDIQGDTRDENPDVGYDEYVAEEEEGEGQIIIIQ